MFRKKQRPAGNFRFRHKSQTADPRKDDVVGSVPLSSKQLRRRRLMMAWLATKCVLIVSFVLWFVSFAVSVWKDSITTNPGFAVGDFNFYTNVASERGGLTRDSILEVTKLRSDTNVMKIDLRALQGSLMSLPQVQTAEVQRFFPNRIDIRVIERQPVAWLACGPKNILPRDTARGRLLDANGVVFECRSLLNQFSYLPVVNIPSLSWVETGKALSDSRAIHALNLIRDFNQQAWCTPLRIAEVIVENDYSLRCTLSDGAEALFAADDTPRQTRRLSKIYQYAKDSNKTVATAKLIAVKNTPVTFVEPVSAPAPARPPVSTQQRPRAAASTSKSTTPIDADIAAIKRGN